MAQQAREQARPRHLRPQLLVAARRADQHRGAGANAEVDRVVGRGVAGVQRDHDVDRRRHERAQVAGDEREAGRARSARRRRCATATSSARSSTPVTCGAPPKRRRRCSCTAKVRYALAAAEVDDANRARRAPALGRLGGQVVERVVEDLEELVDLAPLARLRRDDPAVLVVGDAERDAGTAGRAAAGARAGDRARARRHESALAAGRPACGLRRSGRTPFPADEQLRLGRARAQRRVARTRASPRDRAAPRSLPAPRRGGRLRVTSRVACEYDERERGAAPKARSGAPAPRAGRRPDGAASTGRATRTSPSSIAAPTASTNVARVASPLSATGRSEASGGFMSSDHVGRRLSARRLARQSPTLPLAAARHVRNRRLPLVRRRRDRLPDDPGPGQPGARSRRPARAGFAAVSRRRSA